MRALVTGSAGFIGSQVVKTLNSAGYETTGIDITAGTDARTWFRYMGAKHYDLVVHCAAVVGGRRVMDWTPVRHAANLEIDAALFQWAERAKPGRVVYFSSSCAYPVFLGSREATELSGGTRLLREDDIDLRLPRRPDKLYGWTKLTGELLAATAREAGAAVSVVRPFSVYGPRMNDGFAVRGFAEQIAQRADPVEVWGDAGQVRDYIHVTDVARAVLAMAREGIDGPVNLGTGCATPLAGLVTLMGKIAGYSPQVKVAGDMPAGVPSLVADPSRLHEFYIPETGLADGLAEMLT